MLMKNAENVALLQSYEGDPIERITILETHLRRVLEEGAKLRTVRDGDEFPGWDQAASAAEKVL